MASLDTGDNAFCLGRRCRSNNRRLLCRRRSSDRCGHSSSDATATRAATATTATATTTTTAATTATTATATTTTTAAAAATTTTAAMTIGVLHGRDQGDDRCDEQHENICIVACSANHSLFAAAAAVVGAIATIAVVCRWRAKDGKMQKSLLNRRDHFGYKLQYKQNAAHVYFEQTSLQYFRKNLADLYFIKKVVSISCLVCSLHLHCCNQLQSRMLFNCL